MGDNFYPKVDLEFVIAKILKSDKILKNSQEVVGNTIIFITKGNQELRRRIVFIRCIAPNEVHFELASALAWRFGFMGDLLVWLELNKKWKEGGYIV